ncbi:hypothetical protein MP228_011926 [Amoeboaphelidium protococcarum]|nr:hypothetical protein MP228_011926 [Amoeboaphelidium protococcarum]
MLDKDCTIQLKYDAKPPVGKMYKLTQEEDAVMRDWLKKNVDRGFIRKSQSPYGVPCFFVRKADWTKYSQKRLFMDYCGLNKITIKNRNPLPNISDLFRSLQKIKLFTALNLDGVFELLRVKAGHEAKPLFSLSMANTIFWQCHQSQYTVNQVMSMDIIMQIYIIVLNGTQQCLIVRLGKMTSLKPGSRRSQCLNTTKLSLLGALKCLDCLIAISTATIQCRTSLHQADGRHGQKMSVLRRRGWVSKGFNTRSFQAKLTGHIVTEMHSVSFIIRAGNKEGVFGEVQLQQFLIEENIVVGDTMWEEFDDGQQDLGVENRVPSPQ